MCHNDSFKAQSTEIGSYTVNLAKETHIIYFVSVDTGFNLEFLASTVKSGLTAAVSRVILVCVCFRLGLLLSKMKLCFAKTPCTIRVNTSWQHNTARVFPDICCFHFCPCSDFTAPKGFIAPFLVSDLTSSGIKKKGKSVKAILSNVSTSDRVGRPL